MDQFKRIVYEYMGEQYIEASTKLWIGDRRRFWHVDSLERFGFKGAILIEAEADTYRQFKAVGIADCMAEGWYDNALEIKSITKLGGMNG